MTTTVVRVDGLTCGNCVKHLTEELVAIPGVSDVAVDLVSDGTSTATVTSLDVLSEEAVQAAVDEAGYTLAQSQE